MFENTKTTVSQGSVGLAGAIFYYQRSGYNVSIPIVDNQKYDLIIEKDGKLLTVQVKTSRVFKKDGWQVQLKKVRPNKTKNVISPLEQTDFLFILCGDGTCFSIPFDKLTSLNELHTRRFTDCKID